MHRFFAEPSAVNSESITITGDDVQHISRVLRLKCGDTVSVCDGRGTDYICTLADISKSEVRAQIKQKQKKKAESSLNITLYQGLPKGDKMDFIIQKCVELGVNKIVPVIMKRTVVKPKNAILKAERWQRISAEAAKQSGRGIIPQILSPVSFGDAVLAVKESGALNILPYENEDKSALKALLKRNSKLTDINIIIGPEGGFDDEEIELSRNSNINTVTLGKRILRCETAPIAAVSAVMYELGDW